MLTHDALNTYVADRRQAREQAATTARTGRLLRRARAAFGVPGSTGPATAPVPTPAVSSPVVVAATATSAGTPRRAPAGAVPRTAAPAGAPAAHDDPAAA